MRGKIIAGVMLGLLGFVILPIIAQGSDEMMTPALVKQKVESAAKLIEVEGEAAFPKLRDKNGEFWFGNDKGYIWVHSLEGTMLVHPAQPELEGTDVQGLKDSSGFKFLKAMNQLVKKHGSGWVVYFWAKPGKKMSDYKASYVKLVHRGNGNYVVGCGMYNVNKEFIQSKFPNDRIVTNAK
ncbi:MAG: cache domain-containing protein [Candidatus Omnitrophica bacterium]|nr:cache domain-containing protein [Candidatus Omnitrophota bacterium]